MQQEKPPQVVEVFGQRWTVIQGRMIDDDAAFRQQVLHRAHSLDSTRPSAVLSAGSVAEGGLTPAPAQRRNIISHRVSARAYSLWLAWRTGYQ